MGFGCLVFSAVLVYSDFKTARKNWPEMPQLTIAAGPVQSVYRRKSGSWSAYLIFHLQGYPIPFQYNPSYGRKFSTVEKAIRRPNAVAIVYYIREDLTGPIYSDKKFFTVLALQVDGQEILSYDESKSTFEDDRKALYWMLAFFVPCAGYMFIYAYIETRRKRRRQIS